jgi:hypothetical protein
MQRVVATASHSATSAICSFRLAQCIARK